MPPKKKSDRVIAVTGAAGYIAGRLIATLCEDEAISRVLGFDVRPPGFAHEKFVFDEVDVRNPTLAARLEGVDALVHLAFVMNPIKDEELMRDVNVNGSQNVFRCAGRARVRKVVYTSSATVYGAHPDNDFPLTEESPLRANLDFSYPAHKLEVEYVVAEILQEFPRTSFTIFRPAPVFGPNVDNAWSHALEWPLLFGVVGHKVPAQLVHEDDVASALRFALTRDLPGAYNLAADGWLEPDEALEIIGRRRWELPQPVAFAVLDRLWTLGLAEAPPGMLHYVMHPWVVSIDKLAEAGWRPSKTNREILIEAAERSRGHVRIGRTRVRRADVVRGAVAGVGVIGAVAAARRGLRRRAS